MLIVQDKITTPLNYAHISRPRLHNALAGSLSNCTSTVLQGRAGSGKTLLAADFARRSHRRIAWYTVDSSDSSLPVFLRYFTASIQREFPLFGQLVLDESLGRPGNLDATHAADLLIHELSDLNEPLMIVMDDLHLLYDESWIVPFFHRLLPLLPREAHLLIIGRSLPPAPLWRLRSKQQLCVIEEAALNFTHDEAVELFQEYGLPTDKVDTILAETGGRAALINFRARKKNLAGDMHDDPTRYRGRALESFSA